MTTSQSLPVLLTLTALLLTAADKPNLAGNWRIQQSIAGRDGEMSCTLTQTGNDFTGDCTNERGAIKLTGAVKDDGTLSMSYKSDYEGTPLTVKYTGTLATLANPTKFTGTVYVDPYAVGGEFTATKSK